MTLFSRLLYHFKVVNELIKLHVLVFQIGYHLFYKLTINKTILENWKFYNEQWIKISMTLVLLQANHTTEWGASNLWTRFYHYCWQHSDKIRSCKGYLCEACNVPLPCVSLYQNSSWFISLLLRRFDYTMYIHLITYKAKNVITLYNVQRVTEIQNVGIDACCVRHNAMTNIGLYKY